MPSFSVGMKRPTTPNAARLISRLADENRQIAASLPARIFQRDTGLANSGSSDWRSRSPAVRSIARYMPPMNTVSTKKYGRIENINAARACAVA